MRALAPGNIVTDLGLMDGCFITNTTGSLSQYNKARDIFPLIHVQKLFLMKKLFKSLVINYHIHGGIKYQLFRFQLLFLLKFQEFVRYFMKTKSCFLANEVYSLSQSQERPKLICINIKCNKDSVIRSVCQRPDIFGSINKSKG